MGIVESKPVEATGSRCRYLSAGAIFRKWIFRRGIRMAALVTFVTPASGAAFPGVGAPLWRLVAGASMMALMRRGR
jgi:predicted benzoate:H+ symporter BenE